MSSPLLLTSKHPSYSEAADIPSEHAQGGEDTPDTLATHASSTISSSTQLETALTHRLLSEVSAKFAPHCLFESEAWGTGTASITNEILNLLKNIVGSGGLSLPAGIATFGNSPTALVPAIVAILIMGLLNAYSFSLLGRVCAVTKSQSYQQAWERTFGRRYGTQYNVWVGFVVTGKAVLGCWSFSIVIASTLQPILLSLGLESATRTNTLIGITMLVLLPLCLLEKLSSLATFSIIGQVGTFVTAFTMVLRYLDGSYRLGGRFYDDVRPEFLPSFGDQGALAFLSPKALVLVSILSTGYVAHYNAPRYYFELRDHTTGRFNVVVNSSFLLAALTYVCISSVGFLTFGANCSGFVLDNYSYRDPLAELSRLGVALSVIFAYPLLFQGGRDGALALVGQTPSATLLRYSVTLVLLFLITGLAIWLPDLTFVLSFSGATLSSAIIYVFPPMMFQALVLNCTCIHTYRTNFEVKESRVMMWVGGLLGICGAIVTVIRTFF